MRDEVLQEARRQAEICNACRYCEGFCAAFPALHAERSFAEGDLTQIANLCHNCRGCFYACQYTAPHEFDLNLPAALAEVRQASWEDFAWPGPLAKAFQRSGVAIALVVLLAFAVMFGAIQALAGGGRGFYSHLSHGAMVAIFLPAFLFPLVSLSVSLRRYWQVVGGEQVRLRHVQDAFGAAAQMKNLKGGHGEGCNFEDEDRFGHARRYAHHAVMYGFLLCFLSTASGTILHYLFDMPAPYGILSLPKLFGLPGGVLMCMGTLWLADLKRRADPDLGDRSAAGGEMGFVLLLFAVAASGLALYAFGGALLLALHLGAVLAFFLLTPYTKMAHAPYRFAALLCDAQRL